LAFRLYCRLLLLDIRKLTIKARYFGVHMRRNLLGLALHFLDNANHWFVPRKTQP
jgi:hypothetical protein